MLEGIALGCMGMRTDDFMACTPSEFNAAYDAWHKTMEDRDRRDWERARMICLCNLQPYSEKKLKATDIMRFPWDKKEPEHTIPKQKTAEELAADKERYEKEKEKRGLI